MSDSVKEVWKDIEGFDGLYQISNLGRVKSLWYGKEKILVTSSFKNYPKVNLRKGRDITFTIHRLVASAFIPNPLNKKEVNHINGIKTDNRVGNLEWSTRSENNQHAFDIGLKSAKIGEKCHWAKLTEEQAFDVKYCDNLNIKEVAEKYGIAYNTAYNIRAGNIWKHI